MNNNYKEVFEKLENLGRLLKHERMKRSKETSPISDPAHGQGRILALLKIQPEMTAKDLSYLLGIRQQSLNELLKKLENAGYIERKPTEEDRRIIMIHLTEKGKEVKQEDQEEVPGIFSGFSDEELVQLESYLDRLIENLRASQDESEESDENIDRWMNHAVERMGEEKLEKLVSMSGRPFGPNDFPRPSHHPHHPHHGPHPHHPKPEHDKPEHKKSEHMKSENGKPEHRKPNHHHNNPEDKNGEPSATENKPSDEC